MNRKLGKLAKDEIKQCLKRCTERHQRSAEAERLSKHWGVSKSRIYEISKEDRPDRKKRSDLGKRKADIMQNEALKEAASLVIKNNLDPYKALRVVRADGKEIPVADDTFVKYLRNDLGLGKQNRRKGRTNYRRFEAKLPGDVYQADISGLKERFAYDVNTRKIVKISVLDESKNHPNLNKNRINVWRFVLIDDFSRRKFVKYFAVDKPNSSHFIEFILEGYQEMGVPKKLYTDNDVIIKYSRTRRATEILNKALADCGGYEQIFHLPGNSRATGKVERSHQQIEEFEKILGVYIDRGRIITLEVLDKFSKQLTLELNNLLHRTTNQTPIDRWNSLLHEIRTVDAKLLKSAFLVDEFDVMLNGDLTIRHKGVTYQLPGEEVFVNMVAAQSKANKVRILFPDDADFFTLIFNEIEYDILKVEAAPDEFGSFKSLPEEKSEKARKELRKFATEKAKEEKARTKEGHAPKPLPVIDTPVEIPKTNVAAFPKKTVDVTPQIIQNLIPQQTEITDKAKVVNEVRQLAYDGQLITFWDAVEKFNEKFASKAECKEFLLRSIFLDKNDTQPEMQIHGAVEAYFAATSELRIAN